MGSDAAERFRQTASMHEPPVSSVLRCARRHDAAQLDDHRVVDVLLVDDNTLCRRAVACALEYTGHRVRQVDGAEAALQALEQFDFDVVISDLGMPIIDGFELLRRVRAQRPQLSFLLMSGDSDPDAASRASELGATEYLIKPVDIKTLKATVQNAAELTRERAQRVSMPRVSERVPRKCE